MALCCIGGVCVPYSAIAPLIVLGIKWILEKLVSLGLIPSSWVEKLNALWSGQRGIGRVNSTNKIAPLMQESSLSCCTSRSNSNSEISSSTCCVGGEANNGSLVRQVQTENDWNGLMEKTKKSHNVVVVKFTADWCQPCKAIHLLYCQLAAQKQLQDKDADFVFVAVNVDELDEVAAMHRIAILPTFAVFEKGTLVRRYTGSNEALLTEFVLQQEIKK